jgi:murein peptide amidase A
MVARTRILIAVAVTVAVAVTGAGAAPSPAAAAARTIVLGHSWQGRPITAREVGSPTGRPILVIGSIHGNEPGGIPIAHALARVSPQDLDLWIVPDLNPDGAAAGTRHNAHGIDLNRNFPTRWHPQRGFYASGPSPLSERESRIAHNLILGLHPLVTIWFHQQMNLVWAAGGDRRVERAFARVSRLPFRPLPRLAGTSVTWQNAALSDTTAFAVELPAGRPSAAAVARYVRAVLAAARRA